MGGLSAPKDSQVVLIGFAKYQHLEHLPAVSNNLDDLRNLFLDEAYWGLPESNCQTIENNKTREDIADAVDAAARRVGPEGLLLVYYAGHGVRLDNGNLGLATRTTRLENADVSALDFAHVRDRIRASRASRRLVILDCCYAASASGLMTIDVATDALPMLGRPVEGTGLLMATSATTIAIAPVGEHHTAFTGELFKVLHDGVDDSAVGPDGTHTRLAEVPLDVVFTQVAKGLAASGRPQPKLDARDMGGSIAIVRNVRHPSVLEDVRRVRFEEIHHDKGRSAEVGFLVTAQGGFEAFENPARTAFAVLLATAAVVPPAVPPPPEAPPASDSTTRADEPVLDPAIRAARARDAANSAGAHALWRNWSAQVADDLATEIRERMGRDDTTAFVRHLLSAAVVGADVPTAVADQLLRSLVRKPHVPATDQLIRAFAELLSDLPGDRRLLPIAYQALMDWPALCAAYTRHGLTRDLPTVPEFFSWLGERDWNGIPAWLRPMLVAAGDERHGLDGADLAELRATLHTGWWLVLRLAQHRKLADRVIPALWPWLAEIAAADAETTVDIDAELPGVLGETAPALPANLARLDLCQLVVDDRMPALQERKAGTGKEYVAALAEAWGHAELDAVRGVLAPRLVGHCTRSALGEPPFTLLIELADRTDEQIRAEVAKAIAEHATEDRGTFDRLRLSADWQQRILDEPGMEWLRAHRHLAEVCEDPDATAATVADAYRRAVMAECSDEQMVAAVVPWTTAAPVEQIVALLRHLDQVTDPAAAQRVRAAGRRLSGALLGLKRGRAPGAKLRAHLEEQRDWFQTRLDDGRPREAAHRRADNRIGVRVSVVALIAAIALVGGLAAGVMTGRGTAAHGGATAAEQNQPPMKVGGRYRGPLAGHTAPVWAVAFSPDGKTVATGGEDRVVRLWDISNGKPVGAPIGGGRESIRSIAFSKDGTTVAVANDDHTVELFTAATGAVIGAPITAHNGSALSVAISPKDKSVLATGGLDGYAKLWNLAATPPTSTPLIEAGKAVYSVAFNHDGSLVATGGADGSVRVWDTATGKQHGGDLLGHTGEVRSVAFDADGRLLASGGADRTVRTWNVETGTPAGPVMTGHTDVVRSVAFTPDHRVVSGSFDKTARVWDVATGKPAGQVMTGHTGRIHAVAVSLDGRTVATCGLDNTVQLWELAPI